MRGEGSAVGREGRGVRGVKGRCRGGAGARMDTRRNARALHGGPHESTRWRLGRFPSQMAASWGTGSSAEAGGRVGYVLVQCLEHQTRPSPAVLPHACPLVRPLTPLPFYPLLPPPSPQPPACAPSPA